MRVSLLWRPLPLFVLKRLLGRCSFFLFVLVLVDFSFESEWLCPRLFRFSLILGLVVNLEFVEWFTRHKGNICQAVFIPGIFEVIFSRLRGAVSCEVQILGMHVGAELFKVSHVYWFDLPELFLLLVPGVSLELTTYYCGVRFQEMRGKTVFLLLRLVG